MLILYPTDGCCRCWWRYVWQAGAKLSLCFVWQSLCCDHRALPSAPAEGIDPTLHRCNLRFCLNSHVMTLEKSRKFFNIFTCMKPIRVKILTDAVTLSLHTGAPQFMLRATVFARMTPDQKTQLVEVMQGIEWVFYIFSQSVSFICFCSLRLSTRNAQIWLVIVLAATLLECVVMEPMIVE